MIAPHLSSAEEADILHPDAIVPLARIQAHAIVQAVKFREQAARHNPYDAGTDLHRIWQTAADKALASRAAEQGA